MKKIFLMLFLTFIAGCAGTPPPFDVQTVFRDAEENMHKENFEKARKGYQEIQEKSPDKSYDASLMLRIADTYYGEEKYDEALVEYQAFLNFHPVNKAADYVQYQIAMCSFNQFITIDRDPSSVRTALKEFQTLLRKYPKSEYEQPATKNISACLDHISEYELYVGRFYHKKGAYRAAAGRLDGLLRDYPGTSAEKEAFYYAGLSHLELGELSQARTAFEALIKKYPSMTDSVKDLLPKLGAISKQ
jgi:outer membrane protein assembly factor BamD